MVDGFDMDMLFTKAQSAPTTVPSTTGSDASLRAISTAITTISSKNTACLSNTDKDKVIDGNNMPKDIRERCHFKNYSVKIITKRNLVAFND